MCLDLVEKHEKLSGPVVCALYCTEKSGFEPFLVELMVSCSWGRLGLNPRPRVKFQHRFLDSSVQKPPSVNLLYSL